jgi:hypothetical protein
MVLRVMMLGLSLLITLPLAHAETFILSEANCQVHYLNPSPSAQPIGPDTFFDHRFTLTRGNPGEAIFAEKINKLVKSTEGKLSQQSVTVYYRAPLHCFTREVTLPKPKITSTVSTSLVPKPLQKSSIPAAPPSTVHSIYTYSFGVSTWAEHLKITSPAGTAYPVNLHQYVLDLGINRTWLSSSDSYYLEASAHLLIGGAKAQESSDPSQKSALNYTDNDGTTIGLGITPKIYFYHNKKTNVFNAFGLGIPLIYRRAFLGDPGSSYTLDGRQSLVFGIGLYPRVDFGKFRIDSAFGMLPSLTRWLFSIGITTRL